MELRRCNITPWRGGQEAPHMGPDGALSRQGLRPSDASAESDWASCGHT